ncbi:hypothetical protein C8R46DRAFT_286340 [Mycena filopes]|nr:hypothetical protein C8R46DRAFT_286340 [Mycena filopes]
MPGSPSPSSPSPPAHSQSPPPRAPPRRASTSPARTPQKRISRKVIRTLEGLSLGHGIDSDGEEEPTGTAMDAEEREVAYAVRAGKQRALAEDADADAEEVKENLRPKKIDWEIPRKVFHSSIGFITLGLYLTPSISPRVVALVLWGALAVIAPTDVVRLRSPAVERVYEKALGFLMRESERTGTNGTLWYILGVNFALTFYPIDVATVAILILSWADTAASTIGRAYGPRTAPLPSSVSLAWLPAWVWVPASLLAPSVSSGIKAGYSSPSSSPSAALSNGAVIANGSAANGNGVVVKAKAAAAGRRLKTPFAARKSTAGFLAACATGAAVALVFWWGVGGVGVGVGGVGGKWEGVAGMRAVKEGVDASQHPQYHSQYSIAGEWLRSEGGAWAREYLPEGVASAFGFGVFGAGVRSGSGTGMGVGAGKGMATTTPARFGVQGLVGLVALVVTAGVVSGVAEALDLGGLDDNLTLPIISGGALMLFFRVWGWAVGAA